MILRKKGGFFVHIATVGDSGLAPRPKSNCANVIVIIAEKVRSSRTTQYWTGEIDERLPSGVIPPTRDCLDAIMQKRTTRSCKEDLGIIRCQEQATAEGASARH